MWPDRVSNPRPLSLFESDALTTVLCSTARFDRKQSIYIFHRLNKSIICISMYDCSERQSAFLPVFMGHKVSLKHGNKSTRNSSHD